MVYSANIATRLLSQLGFRFIRLRAPIIRENRHGTAVGDRNEIPLGFYRWTRATVSCEVEFSRTWYTRRRRIRSVHTVINILFALLVSFTSRKPAEISRDCDNIQKTILTSGSCPARLFPYPY